jgi:hypothetical protein
MTERLARARARARAAIAAIGRTIGAAAVLAWRAAGVVAFAFDSRDYLLFVGLALVGFGLSFIYWPAVFLVPGAALAAVAVFGVR